MTSYANMTKADFSAHLDKQATSSEVAMQIGREVLAEMNGALGNIETARKVPYYLELFRAARDRASVLREQERVQLVAELHTIDARILGLLDR